MENTNVNVEAIQNTGAGEAGGPDWEAMKADITNEVMDQLKAQGNTVIPNFYDYGQHILDIVTKYDNLKADYEKQRQYNIDRYSTNVAGEMNKSLSEEYNQEVEDLHRQLNDVAQTDMRWRQHQIQKMQEAESYQVAKGIAFQELQYLQNCKAIPSDLLTDIITPMVNTFDTRSLYIASTMLGGENTIQGRTVKYVMEDLTRQVNSTDSEPFVAGARNYMNSGELDIRLMTLVSKYK